MCSKKIFFYPAVAFAVLLVFAFALSLVEKSPAFPAHHPTIKVGILHSLTGTMAISEKSVADATLLALEEINKTGGVLGMKIEPVIADGKSDPDVFQKEAERLIAKENVKVIFGCWTSASRKAVKAIVEKYNSLLFYPVQYEGLEQSPNIVYMGAAPNQQIIPAVKWSCDNLGKSFFLVGSDYVFPRVANEIAKDIIGLVGGKVVGEEYVPLGGKDFNGIARKIKETKPEVILNTINGDSNIAFLMALHEAEVPSAKAQIMSLSMAENELQSFKDYFQKHYPQEAGHFIEKHLAGMYACWNYFETIDNPLNLDFIAKFRQQYGKNYKVTDPMEAAYFGVYLWSKAVNECKDVDNPENILNYLGDISIPAPEGIITIADNNHARKTVRIGRLNERGDFDIIWSSKNPVDPVPYPSFRDKTSWEHFLNELYQKWNGHWSSIAEPFDSGGSR
ncbi:MAG: urea ABC transporter substrate-binding protein [Candidatus Aureabacteria bacterium]|nr:urea ABC transporter substrate-binding protein [Candidatus Auribacterota bacterium]